MKVRHFYTRTKNRRPIKSFPTTHETIINTKNDGLMCGEIQYLINICIICCTIPHFFLVYLLHSHRTTVNQFNYEELKNFSFHSFHHFWSRPILLQRCSEEILPVDLCIDNFTCTCKPTLIIWLQVFLRFCSFHNSSPSPKSDPKVQFQRACT